MKKKQQCSENNKSVQAKESAAFNHKVFKDTMMTVKEVMNCFDICRTTVYNWEKDLILIPNRIGRRVYYTLDPNKLIKEVIHAELS